MRVISFPWSFLNSSFLLEIKKGKQQHLAGKALHAELRLDVSQALPQGRPRQTTCHPEASVPAVSQRVPGSMFATLHRIRTPRGREIRRNNIEILTHF